MRRTAILILAGLAMAGAAQAQQAPSVPYGSSATMAQHMRATSNRQVSSTSTQLNQERLDRRPTDRNPRREDRAERVAALANAGDCQGAYNLAMAEHDRSMARQVVDLCAAQGATVVTQ